MSSSPVRVAAAQYDISYFNSAQDFADKHRVRIGSQARALENQCYVVHAPLVGTAEWSPATDISNGRAGVYTPVDHGFPEDGILVQGELNQPGWVYADLDLEKMRSIRTQGHVLNHRDWAYQRERITPGFHSA